MGVDVSLHDFGHAAHHEIGGEKAHHGFVHGVAYGLFREEAAAQKLDRLILDAVRKAELLEVQRMHAKRFLEPHRIRSHLLGSDPQKRACFHVVEPTVFHEGLDGGSRTRAFLDLVEKHERLSRFEGRAQVRGEVRCDGVGIDRLREDGGRSFVHKKVQFGEVLIALLRERTH